jgi:hypothetical protein
MNEEKNEENYDDLDYFLQHLEMARCPARGSHMLADSSGRDSGQRTDHQTKIQPPGT